MAAKTGTGNSISLGDDFGDVAVNVNGARVDIHADGSVAVNTKGLVVVNAPANGSRGDRGRAPPRAGDPMPDGTICGGFAPDTGKALYTTPSDAPLTMTWWGAIDYAWRFEGYGRRDWRLPSKAELSVLCQNHGVGALKDTFNEKGDAGAPDWYWASTTDPEDPTVAALERFTDGARRGFSKDYKFSVRLVRG